MGAAVLFCYTKRSRASSPKQEASKAPDDRPEQLRLAPPLEDMLGQRYCATMDDLASLLISSKLVSKVATFEVQATLMAREPSKSQLIIWRAQHQPLGYPVAIGWAKRPALLGLVAKDLVGLLRAHRVVNWSFYF